MNLLVCLKEVPDMEGHFKISADGKSVDREGLVFKMNPFDECAIEEALTLKEKLGGELTLLTLGPESAKQTIRKGLAMGADKAIHVNDPAFNNADSWVVAQALAKAAQTGSFDLILTGVQSEDSLNMQTGIMIAELLSLPHASILTKLSVAEGGKQVTSLRELEGGLLEEVTFELPAVVTIQTGINIPRYPTLPGIMKAKAKDIKNLSASDLGISADSPTQIIKILVPASGKHAEIIPGDEAEAAKKLVQKLKEEAKVI